jgi:heat shock protein HtpX
MKNIYEVAQANKRKSYLVMAGFIVFITLAIYVMSNAFAIYLGYQPGGLGIAGLAFIISGIMSFGSYYWSDKIVLGISGARPADPRIDREFYSVTENLALGSGLPMPKLYLIDDTAPNAFATGRDPEHAAVCATTGLLQKLNRTELEGVIAHELTHVRNYDIRLMSIVSVLVGSVALLADFLLRSTFWGRGNRDNDRDSGQLGAIMLVVGIVFAILSPFIGQIIQLAISRRREFMADAGAVSITRQPSGMISALRKIAGDTEPLEAANKATAHMYFESPFKGGHVKGAASWFAGLFNTHPPVEERIKALQSMM